MQGQSNTAVLVDFGNHYKQLRHAAYAWRHYDLHVLCGKSSQPSLDLINTHELVLIEDQRHELRFWQQCFCHLIRNRLKYNKLIVVTAPEYSKGMIGVAVRLAWLLVCAVYSNHLYIYVKNAIAYQQSPLLRLSLKAARKVLFESTLQMRYFATHVTRSSSKYHVSYVYYSDVPASRTETTPIRVRPTTKGGRDIVVGVIGAFDTKRRDYKALIEAHERSLLDALSFIQIGRYVDDLETKRKVSAFTCFLKEDFSVEELDALLKECDVLLSMNAAGLGYEDHKGTAAFGEAVSVGKPLVVPRFLSVHEEFRDFCQYYDDAESLVRALNQSVDGLAPTTFERFSAKLIKAIEESS